MTPQATYNPTVVFQGSRQVIVENRPLPIPGPGELLIRSHCTLISIGTELSILDDDAPGGQTWREMREYPFLPGYDNVGTVLSVGEGVSPAWIGKRVVSWAPHGAYVTIDVAHCWPVAREITDEEAAFLVLFHVAANGLRRSKLILGETAVIFGLGIIGQLTAQMCQLAGARPVFGVDTSPSRVDQLVKKTGLIGLAAKKESLVEAISKTTRGRMADVVFELTGNADLIPKELEVLREQGRFVIVSSPRSATQFDFHDLCNRPSITIIGAHNWSHPEHATYDNPWTMARHSELFFDLTAEKDLDVASMVSHRIPVEEAPELYGQLLSDRSQALGAILQFPNQPPQNDVTKLERPKTRLT